VEERTVSTALEKIVHTLGALALTATASDDPLALPEPPTPDEVTAYEAHIAAIREQVDPSYHSFLAMSLRDYRAGYPDRAGVYLREFLDKLQSEAGFTQGVSPAFQKQLEVYLADLREL
jgi:hypothetical protein